MSTPINLSTGHNTGTRQSDTQYDKLQVIQRQGMKYQKSKHEQTVYVVRLID